MNRTLEEGSICGTIERHSDDYSRFDVLGGYRSNDGMAPAKNGHDR